MPTYDYACPDCGHKLEVFHKMDETGPKKCPACGKRKLKKVPARPAYHGLLSPMHPRRNRGRGY